MLVKLQKRTVILSQIVGYALTMFVGVTIILLTIQLYFDIKPLLSKQTDVFKNKAAVISKNISFLNTVNKKGIYFTKKELKELEIQTFVKNISKFNSSTFEVTMSSGNRDIVPFQTYLFLESIPSEYLDVDTDDWDWESSYDFLPIIIPKDWIDLYNFSFAESQGLPVFSEKTISNFPLKIEVNGNNKFRSYNSRIVGFSNKINSIMVPENFLLWANKEFGRENDDKTSKLLIEFYNPSDKAILEFFNKKNYSINKDELESSKLVFFFKSAFLFVFVIALIIIILSIAFILLSVNLIIQRNKEILTNLYDIGFNEKRIAKFYQNLITYVSVTTIVFSVTISSYIRNVYANELESLFEFSESTSYIIVFGLTLIILLILMFNILILKNIKSTVLPKKIS